MMSASFNQIITCWAPSTKICSCHRLRKQDNTNRPTTSQ